MKRLKLMIPLHSNAQRQLFLRLGEHVLAPMTFPIA